MKSILLTALIVMPIIAYADEWTPPVTHGLTIISEKELDIPLQLREENIKKQNEMKIKGFNEKENRYAQFLLGLKSNAFDEIKAYRGSLNINDTHLKKTSDEIKLAFSFKKLPINDKTIIGYAPIGSYVKEPKEGWNGIKAFFENKDLGICAYEYTDLKLSNGGVLMAKEGIKYLVNKKPSFVSSEGNEVSGYTYSVTWYNDIKVSRLDCATQTFQKGLIDKILVLANTIDSKMGM